MEVWPSDAAGSSSSQQARENHSVEELTGASCSDGGDEVHGDTNATEQHPQAGYTTAEVGPEARENGEE